MKAVQFSQYGAPEVLQIVELPIPEPSAGQIRIRVKAVGISATDPKIRSGALNFGAPLPQQTGRDVAGIVDAIGADVTEVALGDRVFGIADDGAAAEQCLMTYRAAIPAHLGFVDAAVLPVALDVVGNGILDQLIKLTGDAGKVVTLADFAGAKEYGVHFSNGFADGHAFHALSTIGELIEAGQFWLPVDDVFPLEHIAEAHRVSETGRVRGRIALLVK